MTKKIEEATLKHPQLKTYCIEQANIYPEKIILSFVSNYLRYKNILKGKMDFSKNVEELSDLTIGILKRQKIEKFIKTNIKSELREFVDDLRFSMIEDLCAKYKDEKWLAKDMFSNIAACETKDEVRNYITQYYNNTIEFTSGDIKNKLNNNAVIYVEDNNLLIVEIKNRKGIVELGSNKWCISTYEEYYDHYIEDLKRQFIVYDFSYKTYQSKSMIGITVSPDGSIYEAFDKNNENITNDETVNDHVFNNITEKDIFDMLENRDKVSVISDIAIILNKDELALRIIEESNITEKEVIEIVEKLSFYGHSKTVLGIINNNFTRYNNLKSLNLFASHDMPEAFGLILKNLPVQELKVELWDLAFILVSNQMDENFDELIGVLKTIKKDQTKYVASFLSEIKIYSDYPYYLKIINSEIKDITWENIFFDIENLIYMEIEENSWKIILRGNIDLKCLDNSSSKIVSDMKNREINEKIIQKIYNK